MDLHVQFEARSTLLARCNVLHYACNLAMDVTFLFFFSVVCFLQGRMEKKMNKINLYFDQKLEQTVLET